MSPYGVLPRRVALLAVPMLVACALGTAQSGAATPRPVRASALVVVHHVASVPVLSLAQLAHALEVVVGRPVAISCDSPGVPSSLDGQIVADDADGEVFYAADGSIAPVIHLWASECWNAQRVNRQRDLNPVAFVIFNGKRVDDISGPALLVALHEAFHIALQSGDEGVVECAAYRNAWSLVRQLGLSADDAGMVLRGMQQRHFAYLTTNPSSAPYRAVC